MIFILGIASALFVIVVIVLTSLRLSLDVRLTAIQKEPNHSPLFRRKMNYQQKIEKAKTIRYLLLTNLAIGIAVIIFVGSFLIFVDDYQKMSTQTSELNERIARLESQQKHLIASIPLKNYPAEGIGLKEYDWKKLVDETKDSILQDQIEETIAQKTAPYFGTTETMVSLAVPEILSLQVNGQVESDHGKEIIKRNMDNFAKEAEEIPELRSIHVRMILSVEKTGKIVYSVNYSREKSEGPFSKKNISEQNLKNDGGKG